MRLVSSPLFLASSHFSVPSARLYSYGSPHLPVPTCHCWGSAFPFLLTQAQDCTPPAQLPGEASPAAPGAASISPRHHPPLLVPRACLLGDQAGKNTGEEEAVEAAVSCLGPQAALRGFRHLVSVACEASFLAPPSSACPGALSWFLSQEHNAHRAFSSLPIWVPWLLFRKTPI